MATVVEKLTASVPHWGARLAYGESVTVGGQQLVPAALVVFGFGGGEGSGSWPEGAPAFEGKGAGSGSVSASGSGKGVGAGQGEGSGGGGGGYVVPIGAYVGGPDGVKFRPNLVGVVIVAVPLVSAAGWAIARIVGALSSRG